MSKDQESNQKVLEVEKTTPIKEIEDSSSTTTDNESLVEELEPDLKDIPRVVRDVVTLEDDPISLKEIFTVRYVILSIIFIVPGAFIDTMNSYRTTSAAYSIFFVQIASHYVGKWLSRVLPKKSIGFGKYKILLNDGKEHTIKHTAMIVLTASSGATGSLGLNSLSLSEIYYNQKVNPAVALFFMWSIVFLGYSYAGIARNFLIYDPQYTFPSALMQVNLFNTQKKSDDDIGNGNKLMKVFFWVIIGVTIYHFLPEYVMPLLTSISIICYCGSRNYKATFLGSGLGGAGILTLTGDWANITSSIMINPYFIQVIQFIAYVIAAWILIPSVKFGNLSNFKAGLMSNSLFLSNGTKYPYTSILTPDFQLNETKYEELGPVRMGAQRCWNMFFDFAAYVSGFVWVVLFGYKSLSKSFGKIKASFKSNGSLFQQYNDRLNKRQSVYKDVPLYWFAILFGSCFITLLVIFATDSLFMPWWCLFVALAFGVVIVTPLCWLYALTNFQLPIGTFNELIYGYMIQTRSKRHPAGATVYGALAGDLFYRCQYILNDQKIGHYMQLPPKAVFISQIFGEILGVPINYAAFKWVVSSKKQYLDGTLKDPSNIWTGQSISSYQTTAIQYVVLGPARMFKLYPVLPYGFLVGALAPVLFFTLHKLFPKSFLKFRLWNTTVFFSTMANFYGNISTGYLSQFIGGTITMFYFYRYKHLTWKKYNYLLAAAIDTGYNLAVLLIFIIFASGKSIPMPHWWGNNAVSVERCFAYAEADS
ncbi:OPT7 [Candida pseudojiufengensis]|uniref:OPT7 n=1 Tax=Candida pseudojiufengensis TaxID=497109 RepID=UPI0022251F01|nr:OPT7 [Candida pseudojiufengensis]KAI5962119.1 OPT7 [Candida pseudojiufengensis]